MADTIYLDHHTRTRPSKKGLEEFFVKQSQAWGPMESAHEAGQGLTKQKESAVKALKEFLGARSDDRFLLTSGGAQNHFHLFFAAYLDFMRESGRSHLLTAPTESQWTMQSIKRLEMLDVTKKIVPLNHRGQLTQELLEEHMRPRTAMVSISWANPLTGVVQPIWEIAELCKQKKVLLHVDATYALGKLYVCFEDFSIDFLSFDGNAFHTPLGIGGMLIRQDSLAQRMMIPEDEINLAHLSTLKVCMQEAVNNVDHISMEIASMRDQFEKAIQEQLVDACILFQDVERLPTSSVISFPGASADALLFELSRREVYASMGGGNFETLSKILQLSGIEPELAHCALSFSLAADTSETELQRAVKIIVDAAKKIQKYSVGLKS